jgi:3-hydroxybutyrate dehydrogenase
MSLSGRVVLVTGGGKGLGEAIAVRLAEGGARVAVLGRDRDALAGVASRTGGLALVADVARDDEVERALAEVEARWGFPQIIVPNAGIAEGAPLHATTDALWERTFAVNVTAPFRLLRRALPRMVDSGWGRVVFVASNAGLTGYAYTSAYCASKHAVVGLMRALASEFARTGVTINAVCPGFAETEMAERAIERIAEKTGRTREKARSELEAQSPQRRLMQPAEVAHVVAMLCGDASRGVHGQAIPIDGGQVMK